MILTVAILCQHNPLSVVVYLLILCIYELFCTNNITPTALDHIPKGAITQNIRLNQFLFFRRPLWHFYHNHATQEFLQRQMQRSNKLFHNC